MPTRTYGNTNLTNFTVLNTPSEVVAASISGTNFNQIISGAGNDLVSYTFSDIAYSAKLNFNTFPSIPSSAVITKVEVSLHGVGSTSGPTPGSYNLSMALYDSNLSVFSPIGSIAATSITAPATLDDTISITDISGYTRSQLISKYGTLGFIIGGRSIGSGPLTLNLASSAFTFAVTYDLENYSWYIKPTIKIVNGIPVRIIKDASTDIVPVIDGEDPPEVLYGELPYELYGSGEDFPDGPEYIWWSSIDFWYFFIYSPITPTIPNSPWAPWTPSAPGVTPTCSGCLTLQLGSLDVLVADASGVYVLNTGKLNDTLYNRDTEDISDVKIPNPYIKTSFIP